MSGVFLDTVGMIATWDTRDQWHAAAHAAYQRLHQAPEIEDAWTAYDRGEAAEAGIVDHVSFAVMRRFRLTEAFTNDRHFVAAGSKRCFECPQAGGAIIDANGYRSAG